MSASTTGNITGIYDVAGGAWDYVAGVMKASNGTDLYVSSSGFDQTELNQLGADGKYLDVYEYGTTWQDRTRGHLGDATLEMGPFKDDRGAWYDDYAGFLGSSGSWFVRGARWNNNPSGVGPLAFDRTQGEARPNWSSRIVLI